MPEQAPALAPLPDDLSDIPTEHLLEVLLPAHGAEVAAKKVALADAQEPRLRLFVELERREVSYRAMAKRDGDTSSTAILKMLRRHHTRAEPVA